MKLYPFASFNTHTFLFLGNNYYHPQMETLVQVYGYIQKIGQDNAVEVLELWSQVKVTDLTASYALSIEAGGVDQPLVQMCASCHKKALLVRVHVTLEVSCSLRMSEQLDFPHFFMP
jgi:hypothetical protein